MTNAGIVGPGQPYPAAERGTWATGSSYARGDVVTYQGVRFQTLTGHTATSTFDLSKFIAHGNASSIVGGYNLTPSALSRYLAATGRAMSGGNNLQILCAGDSITAGNNADAPAKRYVQAWPYQLGQRMNAALPVRGTGWLNSDQFAGAPSSLDAAIGEDRFVCTGTIGYINPVGYFGQSVYLTSNTAGTITVGPIACDQIIVETVRRTAAGDTAGLPVTLDTVAQTNLSVQAATPDVVKTTFSPAQGTHTLVISNGTTAGKFGFVSAIKARSGGATGGVEISKIAHQSQLASALATTPGDNAATSSLTMLAGLSADLVILMFGTNEGTAGVHPNTFASTLTTLITTLRAANADVLLVFEFPPSSSSSWVFPPSAYIAAMKAVCDTSNVGMLDLTARWPSIANAQISPWSLYDNLHPRSAGYADIANFIYQALRTVTGGF